ncbi:MAG: cytochrome c biogenesis protein CcdA [Oscillospiraceae bacterium]|nr:cytochrome c biogenesis protein CcdA [Oscillospiraceae bacterium]
MLQEWIENIIEIIQQSYWLAPVIALAAGVLTSLMPCSLASVPLMIGCVSAGVSEKKEHHHSHGHHHDHEEKCCCGHEHHAHKETEGEKIVCDDCDENEKIVCGCCGAEGDMPHTQISHAFGYSLVFCLGMSITFTVLGLAASVVGHFLHELEMFWYIFVGALMIVMALQTFGVINIMPNLGKLTRRKYTGLAGAFISGLLGGLFSSHCAAPTQVMLLAIAAESESILMGPLLLLIYALGHSVLLILTGTFVGFFRKLSESKKFSGVVRTAEIVVGIMMIVFAAYMLWMAFSGGADVIHHH